MLSIKPIPENLADKKTASIYTSIRQTLGLMSVPLVFQYMAAFPTYIEYIWSQTIANLEDPFFQKQSEEIADFALRAVGDIYQPSSLIKLFLSEVKNRPEENELQTFVRNSLTVNSILYLLSLSIRESVKGRFLGLKQIGEKLTENESQGFSDLKDGFQIKTESVSSKENMAKPSNQSITFSGNRRLATTLYSEFFRIMDLEMKELVKREAYLTRRVELERFSINKLHLIPYPFESSVTTIINQNKHLPNFPELIYLVYEIFPTQSPYKLLASVVMEKALNFQSEEKEKSSEIKQLV